MKIANLIIGRRVKADHPVTVLNPHETFVVTQVKFDSDRESFYVRGEDTMWFHEGLVEEAELKVEKDKHIRMIRLEEENAWSQSVVKK